MLIDIDMIAQYIQKFVEAATPWLVCAATGLFVLWLILLCYRAKPFEKEIKRFFNLTPWHKFIVICAISFLTLWGGSKEGAILPSGLVNDISSATVDTVRTAQLRTLPNGLSEAINLLAVTGFTVDQQDGELAFEASWASNLFDYTDSRNIYLFSSTNLRNGAWAPLGAFTMPSETNSYAFTVTSNDVDLAMRPWFLEALAGVGFYRFGIDFDSDGDGLTDSHERFWTFTDPEKSDTDGDGLSDGAELSAAVGTDPLLYDTDGDGVGDGDEIAAGSNPLSSDTDGDGLSDAAEIGTMVALTGDDFMWFDLSGGIRLMTRQIEDVNSWNIPLTTGYVANNVCYTNARVQVDGTVHLLCPTNPSSRASACTFGALSNSQYSVCHISVALCGADLYAKTNDWGSQILHGVAQAWGRTYTVIEYRNVGLCEYRETNETLTCQLILPHDETNTVYVSYLCASNSFREVGLRAGIQCGWQPSFKSGQDFYNLTWPQSADFPEDGLTIKYMIGIGSDPAKSDTDSDGISDFDEAMVYCTNPLVPDTDWDGLGDGDEVTAGTDPLSPDTDGDGMPDGWESRYGLDPLTDDSASDADGDGLSNLREYVLGTSPASFDTDGDGLTDREEVGWWECAATLPEFDVSGGTNLLLSTRSYYSDTFVLPLPFSFRCAGYVHTNVTVGVCGMVGLMADRKSNYSFSVSSSNGDMQSNRINYYHTAVAAYWDYLCAPANSGAQITLADVETNGCRYAVVEYSNIRLNVNANDAFCTATFQVVIPMAETNTVYVRYISLSDAFDGSSATIGAQLPDREQTLQVSYNTSGAVTNGMVVAYHFGTGSDPTVSDTDGDGLEDGEESAKGTSARYVDTDLDGLTDAWECANGIDPLVPSGDDGADGDPDCDFLSNLKEMEYATDPSAADTDGDLLCDGLETGSIFATNALPWLSFDASEDLTAEISTNSRRCASRALPVPLHVQGETVTNLTLSANGLLFLNKAGYANPGNSASSAGFTYSINDNALVLAPYLQYAYIRSDIADRQTSIKCGTATHDGVGYLLMEYLNSFYNTSSSKTNSISFQIAIPTNAPERAYARYADVTGQPMDGRYAVIGMQTFGGRWLHTWCRRSSGRVYDGLSLGFLFGANSDPLVADTDRDGLLDGEERAIGTNPISSDTDGDGMNDGWEQQHANDGFDPTVDNATDDNPDNDPDADPDGDGLTNQQEATAGTSPVCADTDGDGLDDGVEVGQGTDPNDRTDTVPVKWVAVTGDLEMGASKQVRETVTIPAGMMAFVGVFISSEEYPHYTGQASRYNDRAAWAVQANGNPTLEGLAYVNNEDGAWDVAAENSYSAHGHSPVVLKDKAIYQASGGSDLSVSVNIAAMNVSDGALPTTVLVGIFPLKVVQSNMPTGTGVAQTTDATTSYSRTLIPTNGVSYITAHPAAPQLTAQFKNLPQWIDVTWSGSLTTERSERFAYDNRTLAGSVTHGGESYDITAALNNEIVGGRCTLNISVDGTQVNYPFFIRGKNPLDTTARTYISSNVGTDFQGYAWMIAKHESKPANAPRYYNQFNPSEDSYKELPFKGAGADNWGWGIGQIDRGQANDHTPEIYDWHQNVAAMNAKLNDALATYNRFVGYFRDLYQNDPTTRWFEPDTVTTNISEVAVSARMWSVLTFYNGTGGCPRLMLAGRRRQVPLEFNPATTNWVLHVNSENYVYKVVSGRNKQQTE